MNTGRFHENEFGVFSDDVMYAGWFPLRPLVTATTQPGSRRPIHPAAFDAENFLAAIYACQQ